MKFLQFTEIWDHYGLHTSLQSIPLTALANESVSIKINEWTRKANKSYYIWFGANLAKFEFFGGVLEWALYHMSTFCFDLVNQNKPLSLPVVSTCHLESDHPGQGWSSPYRVVHENSPGLSSGLGFHFLWSVFYFIIPLVQRTMVWINQETFIKILQTVKNKCAPQEQTIYF